MAAGVDIYFLFSVFKDKRKDGIVSSRVYSPAAIPSF